MTKRSSAKARKARQKTLCRKRSTDEHAKSWVDDLVFEPISKEELSSSNDAASLSLISWNVLAEAYCSRRSHPNLPKLYQHVVFDKKKRKERILSLLQNEFRGIDIFCFQEVDINEIGRTLNDAEYVGIETPRTIGGGAGGRSDSCAIYVSQQSCEIVEHQLVRLDDIATLSSSAPSTLPDVKNNCSNLQGLQQSFLRRNVGLIVRIRHKVSGRTIVVANCHLYWVSGLRCLAGCSFSTLPNKGS
jgi:hypothetical protein